MEVSPLALVLILGYGLLLALCLTVWSAIAPRRQGDEAGSVDARDREAARDERKSRPRLSNDELRGARRSARDEPDRVVLADTGSQRRHRPSEDDAFERFIRAGKDDGDFN